MRSVRRLGLVVALGVLLAAIGTTAAAADTNLVQNGKLRERLSRRQHLWREMLRGRLYDFSATCLAAVTATTIPGWKETGDGCRLALSCVVPRAGRSERYAPDRLDRRWGGEDRAGRPDDNGTGVYLVVLPLPPPGLRS